MKHFFSLIGIVFLISATSSQAQHWEHNHYARQQISEEARMLATRTVQFQESIEGHVDHEYLRYLGKFAEQTAKFRDFVIVPERSSSSIRTEYNDLKDSYYDLESSVRLTRLDVDFGTEWSLVARQAAQLDRAMQQLNHPIPEWSHGADFIRATGNIENVNLTGITTAYVTQIRLVYDGRYNPRSTTRISNLIITFDDGTRIVRPERTGRVYVGQPIVVATLDNPQRIRSMSFTTENRGAFRMQVKAVRDY